MTQPATDAVHAGPTPDAETGDLAIPLKTSTSYAQPEPGAASFTYSRSANPTVAALEQRLQAIAGGIACVAYGSGMAAIDALLRATTSSADKVLVSDVVYGGTARLLRRGYEANGVQVEWFDAGDPQALRDALDGDVALVFVETPTNPTLDLADLPGVIEAAHEVGVPVAVDNTFLTPLGQPVLELGADVAVHSTTKYLEGHGSAVGGAIVVNRDVDLVHELRTVRKTAGNIADPFSAWQTIRGLETLPLRLERVSATAQRLAETLEAHPVVERVRYPGLDSHPQRAIARRQHEHDGGLLAFELAGGRPAVDRFLDELDVVTLAEHLGTSRTLVTHPATMTHEAVPEARRLELGITEGLLRLSVGLEAPSDLEADLTAALEALAAEARA